MMQHVNRNWGEITIVEPMERKLGIKNRFEGNKSNSWVPIEPRFENRGDFLGGD